MVTAVGKGTPIQFVRRLECIRDNASEMELLMTGRIVLAIGKHKQICKWL